MGRRKTVPVVGIGQFWDALMADYGVAGSYALAIEDIAAFAQLTEHLTAKNLEIYRAETLGTDTLDGAGAITHGRRFVGIPFNTLVTTGALLNDDAGSFADVDVARLNRSPPYGRGGTLVIEMRTSIFQLTDISFHMGLTSGTTGTEVAAASATIFYDSSVGPNFQARSWDTGEEQTDTGIVADTDWHTFRIEITDAAVYFYIDETLVATHTTEIPDEGLAAFTSTLSIIARTLAAVAKSFEYTYAAIWNE